MQIIHLVANKTWGGGEQYVYDLIESLKNEQWCSTSVICKNYQAVTEKLASLDVPLCHLKLNGYMDIKSIIALSKILKKQNEDTVIHTHDFKRAFITIAASKLSGKKNIRVTMTRHLVRKAKKSFFENIVYKNIDKIIFVSQIAKDTCLSSSPSIDQAKRCVIHNGIKDKICDTKYLRDRYQIPNETFVLMYSKRERHRNHCRYTRNYKRQIRLAAGFLGYGQSLDDAMQIDLPCRPCSIYGNKECRIKEKYKCLNDIDIQKVVEKTLAQ